MKSIEFVAGYYEWHLIIDDKFIYNINDQEWSECFNTKKELEGYVEMVVNCMDMEANDYDTAEHTGFIEDTPEDRTNRDFWLSLTDEDKQVIKDLIVRCWTRYCCSDYSVKKIKARYKAIKWQEETSNKCLSYGELAQATALFEKLGRRYGLLKEFRENGIC